MGEKKIGDFVDIDNLTKKRSKFFVLGVVGVVVLLFLLIIVNMAAINVPA